MSNKKAITEEVLPKIVKYLEDAGDFIGREAPLYVKELLTYEAWYHQQWVIWGFIPFLILIALVVLTSFASKTDDAFSTCLFFAVVFFFVALTTVPHSYVQLNKIEKAPRVYLLEHIRGELR